MSDKELVKRLRRRAGEFEVDRGRDTMLDAAADAIDRLTAEREAREKAEAELKEWKDSSASWKRECGKWRVLADDMCEKAARLSPQGWQPIASAPANTLVLLFEPEKRADTVYAKARMFVGMARWGWSNEVANNWSEQARATHWMPLPAPPEKEPDREPR